MSAAPRGNRTTTGPTVNLGPDTAASPDEDPRTPSQRKLDRQIGWGLFAAAFFTLLFTEKSAGFVRDESVYFDAAESYARWFQMLLRTPVAALGDESIVRWFNANHEHPALMKSLFGLSYLLLSEGLNVLRPAAAFRVPAFLAAALILPLVYALARPLAGRGAAAFAATSFLMVPRQFFEAHLACFDVPIAAAWLMVVFCYWRAQSRPRWWWATGLAFGAALATKHNGFFIPLVLIPFALYRGFEQSRGHPAARWHYLAINGVFLFGAALYAIMLGALQPPRLTEGFQLLSPQLSVYFAALGVGGWLTWRLRQLHLGTFRAVAPLVAMAALGPAIFYLHWPYLWHHPVERATWYFSFHAQHNHYTWFYLGRLLREPPFPPEYVVAKTALTVPTSIFVPMCLGIGGVIFRALRRKASFLEMLMLANALASIAVISWPTVPHFGGVKHWFPSMPFLAVLAGASVSRGAEGLHTWLRRRIPRLTPGVVTTALSAAVALPAIIATARVYPYGTSAYSELAGGLPGAASLGMQRQFWANNVTGVLPWINAHAAPGERVYLHENHGGQISDYRRNGMLRADLAFVGSPFEADLVAYQYHQEFREHEFNAWQALGTTKPVTGLYVDETPQVIVYRRSR